MNVNLTLTNPDPNPNSRLLVIVPPEFQMIRANTIRTIVRIICRSARMISVARIIVSQSDYC